MRDRLHLRVEVADAAVKELAAIETYRNDRWNDANGAKTADRREARLGHNRHRWPEWAEEVRADLAAFDAERKAGKLTGERIEGHWRNMAGRPNPSHGGSPHPASAAPMTMMAIGALDRDRYGRDD